MRTQDVFADSLAYRSKLSQLKGRDKIKACYDAYRTIGFCKNIIDMMSDFVSEGVIFRHHDPKQQDFWNAWAKEVKLFDRCERYANTMFKAGFVVIKRTEGILSYNNGKKKYINKKIPLQYTFINPLQIKLYGSQQEGSIIALFDIPSSGYSNIPNDVQDKLDSSMSNLIKTAKKKGKDYIILDGKSTWIDFYKKDDWETYPDPLVFAALPDLYFYEHMRQMDLSAMKGVINVIRIWKLGGILPNGKVMKPNKTTMSKLNDLLKQATGGGTADLIWDSLIDLQDSYPPIDKILGSEKYQYIQNEILSDFGIPEILINGKGNGSYSNQFLGVKTLIEKLEYVREHIQMWLNNEIKIVMQQAGFTEPPTIRFDNINLRDETALTKLIIQMYDRGILSKSTTLDYIDENWNIEKHLIEDENIEETNENISSFGPYKTTDTGFAKGFADPNNGRPDNIHTKHEVKRDTKPKGS